MNKKIPFYFSLLILLTLFKPSLSGKEYRYEIAIAAIFQNEAPYIREWIDFHKMMGVQHFYLYNNLSRDYYKSVLAYYIRRGEVELIDWPYQTNPDGGNWPTINYNANLNALQRATGKVKWLIMIDLDEFIFPTKAKNLTEFLKDYEDVAGVCVNWQMYGTSHVKKIPKNKLLIESLTLKAPTDYYGNTHVKTIMRPEFVERPANPHNMVYKPGYFQTNSNKEPFEGPNSPTILVDKIRINHYCVRDEHYLQTIKIPRRLKWGEPLHVIQERCEAMNKVEDKAIFRFIPLLKERMK